MAALSLGRRGGKVEAFKSLFIGLRGRNKKLHTTNPHKTLGLAYCQVSHFVYGCVVLPNHMKEVHLEIFERESNMIHDFL